MANTDELIREANRNGEEYLRAQMQIALAADQRAISLGGILVAVASVVLGFLFTDSASTPTWTSYVCLFLSLGLGVAAGFAFYAARPVGIWVTGNRPSNWDEEIKKDTSLQESIKEHNRHIDEQIDDNARIIDKNAWYLRWAMKIAAAVVVLSALSGIGLAVYDVTPPPAANTPSKPG